MSTIRFPDLLCDSIVRDRTGRSRFFSRIDMLSDPCPDFSARNKLNVKCDDTVRHKLIIKPSICEYTFHVDSVFI